MKPIEIQIEMSSCYHIDRYSKNMEATAALHTMYSNEAGFYDSATQLGIAIWKFWNSGQIHN